MLRASKFIFAVLLIALSACARRAPVPLPDFAARATTPEFQLLDLNGAVTSLDTLRGKAVVLSFWAPWCFECLAELDAFERMSKAMADFDVEFVAIGVSDSPERMRAVAHEKQLQRVKVLIDERDEVRQRFDATTLPLTFVLDRSGRTTPFPDPDTGQETKSCLGARGWETKRFADYLMALSEE
ncbi:MAG: TlpA family protein disulfide reductase [Deltaproteobacteria bacterium]|nr:TlpA family protein disulfide reductase [Deltaproteobacteria bacterium]